jgi:hypothetical protein
MILIPGVKACITSDWQFTLNIGILQINDKILENLCDKETCYIAKDFIAVKSSYDEKVAIIIGKTSSILGFKGITFRLPYKLNEEGLPEISDVDPEEYDWKNLVKNDLNFLKDLGVIKISPQDIEKISSLATNGKNIMLCNSSWQALEPNCFCEMSNESLEMSGGIVCVKCGAPAFNVKIPEKLLTSIKTKNQISIPFLTIILILSFLFFVVILVKKLKLLH